MKLFNYVFIILVSMLLWACSSSTQSDGGSSSSNTDTSGQDKDPTSEFECEREGYPCTLDEVPKAIFDASVEALEEAYEALDAGDMESARTYLESRDDLAGIESTGTAIRFRLDGGSPVWLIDVTDVIPDQAQGTASHTGASVVGDDTNGDDSVDNRDSKRALVMSPYAWQLTNHYDAGTIAERLKTLPGYEGNVRYIRNPRKSDQNITVADWQSWDDYDAIFIVTHGTRYKVDGRVQIVISSGIFVEYNSLDTSYGARLLKVYSRHEQSTYDYIQYGLSTGFFRTAYPSGLDDAIVSFSACKSGATGTDELIDALTGEDVVYTGWTEITRAGAAYEATNAFVEGLALGFPTKKVFESMQQADLDYDEERKSNLKLFVTGNDQRLIEIPTLLDKNDKPVIDGSNLSNALDGTAGDGNPDVLSIITRLEGVEEGTENEYRLRYLLADNEVAESYGLTEAQRLNEATVTVEHQVTLGFDAPAEPSDLMVITDLPEGGESRYVAEVDLVSECGWTMTFSGPDNSGSYEGGFGGVQLGPPTSLHLGDNPMGASNPGIAVILSGALPEEVPATLTLGLSGSESQEDYDGALEIGFGDVTYKSGDGSPCCTATNPADNFTSPVTLELEVNEADRIEGTISGEVWAFSETGGTPLRKADVQIDFTVSNGGECRIYDPSDPL